MRFLVKADTIFQLNNMEVTELEDGNLLGFSYKALLHVINEKIKDAVFM